MSNLKIIKSAEAKKIMDTLPCKIIDVRTKEEFEEVHIPNAILIPLDDMDKNIESIISDKNEKLLVYCKTGMRSIKACQILSSKGYKDISSFGGINSWIFDRVL